jgi:hypothetical protein
VRRHLGRARVDCVGVLILVLTLSACVPGLAARMLPAGQMAPDFAAEGMEGTVALSELRGSIVVLSFWSST